MTAPSVLRLLARWLPALFAAALLQASPAAAEPAAWFLWRSLVADGFICAQVSPGDGWQRLRGPFRDALCQKPGVPG
jgi:hypothetical protein